MDSDSMSACKCLNTDIISDTNKMKRSEGSDSSVQSNSKAHKNSNVSVVGANSFKVDYKNGTKELIIKLQALPPGMSSVKLSQNDVKYGFYPDSQRKYHSNRQRSTRRSVLLRNYTSDLSTEIDSDSIHKGRYDFDNSKSACAINKDSNNDSVSGCEGLSTDIFSHTNKMKRREGSDSNVQCNTKAHKNGNVSVVGANSFKVDYKNGTKELKVKLRALPPGILSVKLSQSDVEYDFYPDSQEKYSSNRQKSTRPEIHKDYMNKETENDEERSRDKFHDSDSDEHRSGHKGVNECSIDVEKQKEDHIVASTIVTHASSDSISESESSLARGKCSTLLNECENEKNDKDFKCKECNKAFECDTDLMDHMAVHICQLTQTCLLCDKCFGSKTCLNRHMLTHLSKRSYACQYCPKSYTEESVFTNHMKLHETQEVWRKNLAARFADIQETRVPASDEPQMTSIVQGNLSTNETESLPVLSSEVEPLGLHNGEIRPDDISESGLYSEKRKLKSSFSKECVNGENGHEPKVYCKYCTKSFKRLSGLCSHMRLCQGHMQVQENVSTPEIVLSPELEIFRLQDGDIEPAENNASHLPYICTLCNKCFKSKEYLKIHVQNHIAEEYEYKHRCGLTTDIKSCQRAMNLRQKLKSSVSNFQNKDYFSQEIANGDCNIRDNIEVVQDSVISLDISVNKDVSGGQSMDDEENSVNQGEASLNVSQSVADIWDSRNLTDIVLGPELKILRLQDGDRDPAEKDANYIPELPYICTLCNTDFKSKKYLKIHVEIHIAEESYKKRCGLTTDIKLYQRAINLRQKLTSSVSTCTFHNLHIPNCTGNQRTCIVQENLIANESESSPGLILAVESLPLQDEELKTAVISDLEIYNKDYFSQEIANERGNIGNNIVEVQDSVISLDISVNKDICGGHSIDDVENCVNQGKAPLNVSHMSIDDISDSRNLTVDETEPFPVLCFKVKPLMAQDEETEPGVIIDPEIHMDYMNMTENDSVNSREDEEGANTSDSHDSSEDLSDNDGASEHNMNFEENVKTTVLNIGVSDISESGIGYANKKLRSSLHMNKRKQKSSLFKCQECNQCFKQKAGLVSHMILHRQKITHKCSICDRYFARRDLLYKHLYYTHVLGNIPEKMYCNYCNKPYSKQSMLTKHMESCQVQNNIRKHSSANSEFQDMHVPVAKVNQNPMIQDNLIDNETKQFSVLSCKVEPLTVQNEETEPAIYSDIAVDAYYMNPEMRSAPNVDDQDSKSKDAPLTCTECGIHFNCVDALISHSQQHNGSVLDCTICGAKFHLVHELQAHLAKHMSDNPYIAFNLQAMYVTK